MKQLTTVYMFIAVFCQSHACQVGQVLNRSVRYDMKTFFKCLQQSLPIFLRLKNWIFMFKMLAQGLMAIEKLWSSSLSAYNLSLISFLSIYYLTLPLFHNYLIGPPSAIDLASYALLHSTNIFTINNLSISLLLFLSFTFYLTLTPISFAMSLSLITLLCNIF